MAAPGSNRYAMFASADSSETPVRSPAIDHSQNPFLNQIADDSMPWQEVKKRGAPAVQPAPPVRRSPQVLNDRTKAILNRPRAQQGQDRIVSGSTDNTPEKAYDPHENWCGVCSYKFANKAALLSHIKQSVGHENYCNLCKRVFVDRNGLKNHVDNAANHEVHCNLCLSAFKDDWALKNHFENNYSVGHEWVCLTCLLGFNTRAELERHLQTAAKHTWCGTCQRRFRNQDERDAHWEQTNSCDFDGPDQSTLAQHLKCDHFQCEGCKRILPSFTKLTQHYESCAFALACPQCGEHCAGKTQLGIHLENCFLCEECDFHTHHEGNYHIHMTKHRSADIGCWACEAPMRTYSSLINHLESGKCPNFNDPALLTHCLGKWWYSALYMDLDMHASIRIGRVDIREVQRWSAAGDLHPFVCRDEGCGKVFGHLSSLVLHCESQACGWGVDRLNMPGLEKEFKHACLRRDSATA
ncbi:uncharacterized protein J4E88_009615 [Alternaria novae-zelandiae]|uniref:uncharacterized protein n=1 Tax=Alternaria novae-zelandiae TaxID=430562 RepID=UPI0020C1E6BC|nr:uncharacterized protein J4E88_009615 [Alternaria novae-zelandiae]KAI4670863.1 hypothetical protein J4E88_009615 [Alternaria novae-zelandiae]